MDDVPDGLQAIIDKTLAKRCEDRYADAKELAESVEFEDAFISVQ
ncbi:MAG: hypothetical protein ACLT4X_07840 [Phascolarctobacterium sp.]